jgi:hypothetical protein
MTFDDQLLEDEPQVVYDDETREWLWLPGAAGFPGVVDFTRLRSEIKVHQVAIDGLLRDLTTQMYAGGVNIPNWQATIAAELQEAHMANAMFGAGGAEFMTPEMWARTQATIEKEVGFLTNFADEIERGIISERQAVARIQQYSNAIEQSYWEAWNDGIDTSGFDSGLSPLPTVPGAGDTPCRGNCQCWLEFTDNGIIWHLNDAVHCEGAMDCPTLADGSPYAPIR